MGHHSVQKFHREVANYSLLSFPRISDCKMNLLSRVKNNSPRDLKAKLSEIDGNWLKVTDNF